MDDAGNRVGPALETSSVTVAAGHYAADRREGWWQFRSSAGDVYLEGRYIGGLRDGAWLAYDGGGQLLNEMCFDNGTGTRVRYSAGGEIVERGPEVGGKRDGRWEFFDVDGQVTLAIEYAMGTPVKETAYADGRVVGEGSYKNGQRDGDWTWKAGDEIASGTYREGKLDGVVESVRLDGSRARTCHYAAGELDGTCRRWHPNGELEAEESYSAGVGTGVWRTWDENGLLTSYVDRGASGLKARFEAGRLVMIGVTVGGVLEGPLRTWPAEGHPERCEVTGNDFDCTTDWNGQLEPELRAAVDTILAGERAEIPESIRERLGVDDAPDE